MKIDDKTIVEKAYKKLKSSVYFDKTQLILRNDIVEFENNNFERSLHKIYNALFSEDEFLKLQNEIIRTISVLSYPKKVYKNESSVISNSSLKEIQIEELQYFIKMNVEGHILGVLWIMLIGYKMDKEIYEHSYGNRIRKKLINELSDNPTYSPYLFEPYFVQYESWRDTAMSEAQSHMSLEQDVVIITMDFRRYYYSVDADKYVFNDIYKKICEENNNEFSEEQLKVLKRLNDFICAVVEEYSKIFGSEFDERHILPIGFLPSNILGNWCLRNFDKAIVEGWNPIYYGRYVDDILIVDKVEHNSEIYLKAQNSILKSEEIIEFFLRQCSRWNNNRCCEENNMGLLDVDKEETPEAIGDFKKKGESGKDIIYHVNPKYNVIKDNKSKIIVHNGKVKIFYFKSGESDALLTSFKNNILKNKSEFRHLPEDEAIFQKDDYDEIYSLKNSESPNKLRGVDSIEINKFNLSKFLGKYLRIGGMVKDKHESRFEKDILKIFDLGTIVENYTAWEKVIEIFVINERFDTIVEFVTKIIEAIGSVFYHDEFYTKNVKNTLYKYLHSILCRTFALVWKKELRIVQDKIYSISTFANSINLKYDVNGRFDQGLNEMQIAYCKFCMIDKSVLPINILMLPIDDFLLENTQINLTNFGDVLPVSLKQWNIQYKYFPYVVNMYDFNMISFIEELKREEGVPFSNYNEIHSQQKDNYIDINYNIDSGKHYRDIMEKLVSIRDFKMNSAMSYLISIGDGRKPKLKLAVANVKLDHQNFQNLVLDMPNRCYTRYRDLSSLVNQAIDQKVDMLVMPEAYVPFEWLSTLARTCAKNNLAVVTGVEHIKMGEKIFNFTAVILPYSEEEYKCAYISFHLKNHYAPHEKELINGYRLKEVKGDHYELYKWNDCYFPVYCCYELTSISDRAIFQSYADLLIAVEWNKDVNYYSNILESLSRDVHCYCVQVNTSDYGDSRITKPSKTEEKDIIRTKGGINSTILVGNVDINELREFQLKEYALQKGSKFKPTPPGFDPHIVLKKIRGENI